METQRVTIDRMAYGSAGVGRLDDGKVVFVDGAAPGELVEVEPVDEKPSWVRARLVRVLEASPARQPGSPPQPGAPWAHLTYDAQLKAKRDNVVGALVHTARFDEGRAEALVGDVSPCRRQWGYRNKMELQARADERGRLCLGLVQEGGHELVTPERYPIAHGEISRACTKLQGALRYAQGSSDLGIHRVGVRHSMRTRDLEVALWATPGPFPRAAVAKIVGSALPATSVVRVLSEPGRARAVKGLETLSGRGRLREELCGFSYEVSAPSFFQVNTAQAEKLVGEVLRGLGGTLDDEGPGGLDGLFAADLYAGAGTFTLPMAAAGADVVAVESAGSSVRDLRRNAEANGVEVDVIGGDAARELAGIEGLDALVVDPPRSGLSREALAAVLEASPRRVVSVACDPATWARDVARLEQAGYRLQSARPVDMFPQTYHVEVVGVLAAPQR